MAETPLNPLSPVLSAVSGDSTPAGIDSISIARSTSSTSGRKRGSLVGQHFEYDAVEMRVSALSTKKLVKDEFQKNFQRI